MKKIKLKRPQQKKDKDDHLLIEKQEPKTKLEAILFSRNLKQGDLRRMILNNSGFMLGRDRISKICTGRMIKYNLETAVMIAEALDVKVDDIIELKDIRKKNSVPNKK
jgi:DNA-binding Xre family transcriptional regulator